MATKKKKRVHVSAQVRAAAAKITRKRERKAKPTVILEDKDRKEMKDDGLTRAYKSRVKVLCAKCRAELVVTEREVQDSFLGQSLPVLISVTVQPCLPCGEPVLLDETDPICPSSPDLTGEDGTGSTKPDLDSML